MPRIETFKLEDDGSVPNHPRYPLVVYHGVFQGAGTSQAIGTFAENGWRGAWVNGIFPYHHYHACAHEVLANVGPAVSVQFGGEAGPVLTFAAGMAVAIPAGCGHCRVSGPAGLTIVGAYPAGQEDWDLKRADAPEDHALALSQIPDVARPELDPVLGAAGPLLQHWI